MKGILKFNLPEETSEFHRAVRAQDAFSALDDFKNWVKKLNMDVHENGFLIVKQTGVTGSAISITRGSTYGKTIHITSGGKTSILIL